MPTLLPAKNPCLTVPKAFQGVNPATFQDSSSQWLSLVDGGSNLEQVPLGSLFTKARALDVVIAVDASSDDANQWPKSVAVVVLTNEPANQSMTVERRF